MARVVVVGAGFAGLAAAARLVRAGHDVVVCERSDRLGGALRPTEREGFTFDNGPGLLALPAVYRDLFRKSGKPLEDELELTPVEPARRYAFADGTDVDLPNASRAATNRVLNEHFGAGTSDRWDALIGRAQQMWRILRDRVPEAPTPTLHALLHQVPPRDVTTLALPTSLRRFGTKMLRHPHLQAMVEHQAWQVGSHPGKAPAMLAAGAYVEQTFGLWQVEGGTHRLGAALADRVQAHADIRTGTGVAQIVVTNEAVRGVQLADGSAIPAHVVVWAAPSDPWGRAPQEHYSAGLLTVHLALRGTTDDQPAQILSLPDDREHSLDEVFSDRLAHEPILLIDRRTDTAPAGHESWSVTALVPPNGNFGWSRPTEGQTYAERILKVLERRGFAVDDRLLWHIVRTPYDIECETGTPGGAVFGPPSHGLKGVLGRAPNRGDVFGLYQAGAGAHPGAGLANVGMSASTVANLIGPA